jgi:hypothetical protein
MRTRGFALVLLAALTLALTAGAQSFWEKKEWKQWSKDEAKKMTQDSPWAQKISRYLQESAIVRAGEGRGGETTIRLFYIVQLRSALPLRQGVIRQAQIDSRYERMSEADRKAFDDSAARFLANRYEDVIVVHVYYGSENNQEIARDMARYWQGFPSGTFPVNMYLINSRGQRQTPIRWISASGSAYEFEAIFARLYEGEPFLTPEDKALRFEFHHPNFGGLGEERMFVEFKTNRLMHNGELAY